MSLVDTTDGVIMLGAYEWAFVKPIRKLYYNLSITFTSVVVTLLIGGRKTFDIVNEILRFTDSLWEVIGLPNDSANTLGLVIIGVFAAVWTVAHVIYPFKRLDESEIVEPSCL
jgi:high-affinity nickel-transport protein